MTEFSDLHLAAMDVLLDMAGVSVTYTEAGGGGQTALALEEDFTVDGDNNATLNFKFESTDLTIASWRGAKITASNGDVYKVTDKSDTAGMVMFTGIRAVERS